MSVTRLRERINGDWLEARGGLQLAGTLEDVRRVARQMRSAGARFVALVGAPGSGEELRLCWHFDVEGTLLWLEACLEGDARVPTIVDIYPGADWAEREARDYFAVSFEGRQDTEPLMLRAGDAPGVLNRDQGGGS